MTIIRETHAQKEMFVTFYSLTLKETNLWDYLLGWASYKTPWHHNTKCVIHRTLTCTLLSLTLLSTKLIAAHHPHDSCIDLHSHTYHLSNEHHHSYSSFQRPFIQSAQFWIMHQQERSSFQRLFVHSHIEPTLTNIHTSIHGKKGWISNPIHDENPRLESILELWKHFNIQIILHKNQIEASPWKCHKEVFKVFSFNFFFALGWHLYHIHPLVGVR